MSFKRKIRLQRTEFSDSGWVFRNAKKYRVLLGQITQHTKGVPFYRLMKGICKGDGISNRNRSWYRDT
ncbi:hypothetical protein WAI453_008668 [Rhynchosporium graminicola]